jgi:hypothetical protein
MVMADDKTGQPDEETKQPVPPAFVDAISPQRAEQQAIAFAAAEAKRLKLDEELKYPGGRYLVNGIYVTAEGERHKDQKSE